MHWVKDWPFKGEYLELSAAERRTLLRAAAIAEKAAELWPRDSWHWEEAKALEHRARDMAACTAPAR